MPLHRRLTLFLCLGAAPLVACHDSLAPDGVPDPSAARQPLKKVWTVTSLADPGVGQCTSGACTLRQALTSAANGDKIVFKSNLSGTIALTVGFLPFFNGDVTVDGAGRIAIDAQDGGHVLVVAQGRTVTLNGLTLTGGFSAGGGGILNNGTLAVTNSTITRNESSNNGAGIENSGTLTLLNTTVSLNTTTGSGGGIYSTGQLTIRRSTISSNFASVDGGGISTTGGSATITASTISGNVAGSGTGARGGGIFATASMLLRNSTVTANIALDGYGGGIFAGDNLTTVANSIVAGNIASVGECAESDRFTSLGYNLTTVNGGCPFEAATDLAVKPSQLYTEVLEQFLGDHGGPTATHALIERGRAVDAGYCPGETADQRGAVRPADEPLLPNVADGCDIGAFEWQPPVTGRTR